MPNGFHGSDKDWQRMEQQLRTMDPALKDFARGHGMWLTANYHSWPERTLNWGGELHRIIQLYLDDPGALTWHLWLCAYEDRGKKRFWKNTYLKRAVPMTEIQQDLVGLLERGRQLVEGWTSQDLQVAGEITG